MAITSISKIKIYNAENDTFSTDKLYMIDRDKLLWVNSSPTSSKGAFTASLGDCSNFKYITIFFVSKYSSGGTSYDYGDMTILNPYYTGRPSYASGRNYIYLNDKCSSYNCMRKAYFTGNSAIYFLNGRISSPGSGNYSDNSNCCVPLEIWGTNSL